VLQLLPQPQLPGQLLQLLQLLLPPR
jgi:hypothetical protein